MPQAVRVLVETGRTRVFASALDWPGWSRSGRTEAAALDSLARYLPRYAPVVEGAGLTVPVDVPRDVPLDVPLDVVERVPGNATTDFGAPDAIGSAEVAAPDPAGADRMARLVAAAWRVFDEIVAGAPEELRKGPRGGGRDRTTMVAHVLGAEASYARRLGLSHPEPAVGDVAAVAALRAAVIEVLRSGEPVPNPRRRLWPVAYAARRIAWHVLDHAWEMEDRSS